MPEMTRLACFKAYDVRGRVPADLDSDLAYRIGRAYAAVVEPQGAVSIGRDIRDDSEALADALARGLNDSGVDTFDLGLCGTEITYHAAADPASGGAIMVTASHNPLGYNGLKLVRAGAVPVSGDSGLFDIEALVRTGDFPAPAVVRGTHATSDVWDGYVAAMLAFVDVGALRPLKLVVNAGNGCAGPAFDRIVATLPFEVVRIQHEPDSKFPNGVPNPLIEENRAATASAVRAHGADLGIAWDGDFDRCFLFDETGRFIEGYYIVGLLAAQLLAKAPGETIIHDPRLTWNTHDVVAAAGGQVIQSKTGHAFIKERMRAEDALYGGEMSAHHYFRDFAYCDSGMIPWLLVTELMSTSGRKLSSLVDARMRAYPCSGEINFQVSDMRSAIARVHDHFLPLDPVLDTTDGIGMEFARWRFNLRASNTESLLRLNVETRGDAELLAARTAEIRSMLTAP